MTWLDETMVGFDTETTGVSTAKDRIVTAAIITRRAGEEPSTRTWLVNPGIEIPAAATRVHGITTEQARAEGADPKVALDEIAEALAAPLAAGMPVVGFNAQYDLSILETELARHGLPSLESRLERGIRPIIDPLVIDRFLDRYRKGGRKLIDMCRIYAVPVVADDLHAADADVLATLDLLPAMAHMHPSLATVALDDLHDQQIEAHRLWATRFAAFLKSKGETDDLPSPLWPVSVPETQDEPEPASDVLF